MHWLHETCHHFTTMLLGKNFKYTLCIYTGTSLHHVLLIYNTSMRDMAESTRESSSISQLYPDWKGVKYNWFISCSRQIGKPRKRVVSLWLRMDSESAVPLKWVITRRQCPAVWASHILHSYWLHETCHRFTTMLLTQEMTSNLLFNYVVDSVTIYI